MKKNKIIKQTALFFILVFSAVSSSYSKDSMEYLTSDIDISVTSLHEWMPSVAYNSIENEFLIMWHSTGVREEGGENMYSLHA